MQGTQFEGSCRGQSTAPCYFGKPPTALASKQTQAGYMLRSPGRVRLGVKEQLRVANALCRRPCQVGICKLVQVSLCQQHRAAGVVEGEEVLQGGWVDACSMERTTGRRVHASVQLAGQQDAVRWRGATAGEKWAAVSCHEGCPEGQQPQTNCLLTSRSAKWARAAAAAAASANGRETPLRAASTIMSSA